MRFMYYHTDDYELLFNHMDIVRTVVRAKYHCDHNLPNGNGLRSIRNILQELTNRIY